MQADSALAQVDDLLVTASSHDAVVVVAVVVDLGIVCLDLREEGLVAWVGLVAVEACDRAGHRDSSAVAASADFVIQQAARRSSCYPQRAVVVQDQVVGSGRAHPTADRVAHLLCQLVDKLVDARPEVGVRQLGSGVHL